MTRLLTYVEFLSVFVALPVGVLAAVVARRARRRRRVLAGVAVLVCIAASYTAPWDSYLIGRGVWSYGEGVVAVRFARIPLGEWLFFGLQTALTGLWYYALASRLTPRLEPGLPAHPNARRRGLAGWTALALLGVALAFASSDTYYLGMILLWAAPVAAFLWAVGGPVVWRYRRLVAAAVAGPSVYLWVVDRFAIESGLWTISPAHSSGVHLFGLPVEEAVFFLLTNVLVVQGLLLFDWTLARADDRGPGYALDGLLPGATRLIPAAARVRRRWR